MFTLGELPLISDWVEVARFLGFFSRCFYKSAVTSLWIFCEIGEISNGFKQHFRWIFLSYRVFPLYMCLNSKRAFFVICRPEISWYSFQSAEDGRGSPSRFFPVIASFLISAFTEFDEGLVSFQLFVEGLKYRTKPNTKKLSLSFVLK